MFYNNTHDGMDGELSDAAVNVLYDSGDCGVLIVTPVRGM